MSDSTDPSVTAVLFQSMPPLSPEEYASLEASIAVNGVQVPIIVDEFGVVIDGHHRKRIADSLGIEYPTTVRGGLTDAEKRTLALSVNIDRRQIGREQRRELIAASLKADPQLSSREHARRTGAHHTTVETIRQSLESTGEISQSEVRISGDGRERPATQPDRPVDDEPSLSQEECEALDELNGFEDVAGGFGVDLDEPDPDEPEGGFDALAARIAQGLDAAVETDRPAPAPPTPKSPARKPITDAFFAAAYSLGQRITTLTNLAGDDRFKRNADQLAQKHLSDLIRSRDALQRVIDQLTNTKESTRGTTDS